MSGLIGIIAALATVVLGAMTDGDPISSLFSLTALIIVFGGTFAALLTQFGGKTIMGGLTRAAWVVKSPQIDLMSFIEQLATWTNMARSQGALALEGELEKVKDPFQRKGLQMIIDNTRAEDVHPTLAIIAENATLEEEAAAEVWESAGGYSPTIGVMGAVLGLIHVMMRLDHPEELGAGIATAFVATIYGVGGANLIFLPIGTRLAGIARARAREREVVIQGFVLMAEGKPGILIRQTLHSFLTDSQKKVKAAAEAEPTGELAPGAV
jgi:chemotaxis protein MotA